MRRQRERCSEQTQAQQTLANLRENFLDICRENNMLRGKSQRENCAMTQKLYKRRDGLDSTSSCVVTRWRQGRSERKPTLADERNRNDGARSLYAFSAAGEKPLPKFAAGRVLSVFKLARAGELLDRDGDCGIRRQ